MSIGSFRCCTCIGVINSNHLSFGAGRRFHFECAVPPELGSEGKVVDVDGNLLPSCDPTAAWNAYAKAPDYLFSLQGAGQTPVKTDYSLFPPFRAALAKWHDGQLVHGPVFQGDALSHLYEEMVDAHNYISELENKKECLADIGYWRTQIDHMLSEIWRALEDRRSVQLPVVEEKCARCNEPLPLESPYGYYLDGERVHAACQTAARLTKPTDSFMGINVNEGGDLDQIYCSCITCVQHRTTISVRDDSEAETTASNVSW